MPRLPVLFVGLSACAIALIGTPQPVADGSTEATNDQLSEILVSRQLFESQGFAIDDVVSLSGNPSGTGAQPFRIVGTYEPVPNPMRITSQQLEARLHLPDLLELTDDPSDPLFTESVTAINVALNDPADAREFTRQVWLRVAGVGVGFTSRRDEGNPFVVLERFHLAIALVTIIASTAFLLALMVIRTDERRETVAILRLIGVRKRRVLMQVFVEGLFLAVAGAVFGIALALLTQGIFNRFFQWHYDTALVFVRISPRVAWQCVALAVPLGVLASVVASWTLLRREALALLHR